MTIKVAVLGAKGRMGAETVKAISAAPDLSLVAQIDLGDSIEQITSNAALGWISSLWFVVFVYG